MQESNGSQGPSHAPDFNQELQQAQATGDFDFVLETAKKSHKMLLDFRDVVKNASYSGSDAPAVAMGLNFLENMIANSASQLNTLKQTEKATREALKAAIKAQKNGEPTPGQQPLAVLDPEKPADPPLPPPPLDQPEPPSV